MCASNVARAEEGISRVKDVMLRHIDTVLERGQQVRRNPALSILILVTRVRLCLD
jgi:hypothetical protein